ncbi:MAG: radical SAM protein, partial [Candidatus Nanoarchaeia archaeon]
GRVDNAKEDVLKQMARAGAKVCYFGAESANQHVLDYYKKGITPQQTIEAVNKARRAGIDFLVASFILGAPNETASDIERTIKFMTKLDVDFVQVTNLIAYPGTELWDDFVTKGYLDPNKYWEAGVGAGEVYPGALSHEYVISQVKDAYARFVGNYKLKARHVWRLFKSGFRRDVLRQNLKYFDKDLVKRLIGKKK